MDAVWLPPENLLQSFTFCDVVVCPYCQLSQFEPGNGKCRRCHHRLGLLTYVEFFLSEPLHFPGHQAQPAVQMEVGGLIRKLRSRRGMTEAALASLTGIHRTYLSAAEHGRLPPSAMFIL